MLLALLIRHPAGSKPQAPPSSPKFGSASDPTDLEAGKTEPSPVARKLMALNQAPTQVKETPRGPWPPRGPLGPDVDLDHPATLK